MAFLKHFPRTTIFQQSFTENMFSCLSRNIGGLSSIYFLLINFFLNAIWKDFQEVLSRDDTMF